MAAYKSCLYMGKTGYVLQIRIKCAYRCVPMRTAAYSCAQLHTIAYRCIQWRTAVYCSVPLCIVAYRCVQFAYRCIQLWTTVYHCVPQRYAEVRSKGVRDWAKRTKMCVRKDYKSQITNIFQIILNFIKKNQNVRLGQKCYLGHGER